jgi:FAD/FMN-containing dehydrogenase
MDRRKFLKGAMLLPGFSLGVPPLNTLLATDETPSKTPYAFRRVRPGDPHWPSEEKWNELKTQVNGNLIKLESPLAECKKSPGSTACNDFLKGLKNPYFIGDNPALTQTSGWLDAWTSEPSVYAVAAVSTADVVAAVNFARTHNLRLVVKGGGHSYQGTSNSADSLLIWTRAMNKIVLHDSFVGKGCEGRQPPQPAVTVEAGAIWWHTYNEVTTKNGRYVQGGGCATVGVAGLIQSGGFGSLSKHYGMAAAALLEAEIVTADGIVRTVNAAHDPELFWALKGGGGGSFGVVTRLTLRTRELPEFFGGTFGAIKANSDEAFKKLVERVLTLYHDELFNHHWGEQIIFRGNNTVRFSMTFHGLTQEQAQTSWKSFEEWVKSSPQAYSFETPISLVAAPARRFWDATFFRQYFPSIITSDDRPGASQENVYWTSNIGETGQFLWAYHSAWLPKQLLEKNNQQKLADALFSATRSWSVSLHFNKGLAGAPAEEIAAAKDTATNPEVLNAFALAIIAGEGEPAFPGIAEHEPDLALARSRAIRINEAMNELLKVAPNAGSYVSESSFFEENWQQSFWGSNYPRLAKAKKKYDPEGLFFVHHGVGTEKWSADGFTRFD